MTTTTRCSTRTLGMLVAVASVLVVTTVDKAIASAVSSDEMVISIPGGPVIFDNSVPEVPPAGGAEDEITFAGGPANVIPPPVPLVGVIGAPGTSELILSEPTGELPDPGEPLITFPTPNGPIVVSDLIISTLGNQATLPPFITLVSDGNPDLQQLVPLLSPSTPVLGETGVLQDVTPLIPFAFFPGIGPITIQVASDVVPEPSSIVLTVLAGIGLAAGVQWSKRRIRKS